MVVDQSDDGNEKDDPTGDNQESKGTFRRRSCLKLLGTGAATLLGAGVGSSTVAGNADYRTVEVSTGETKYFRLGDGDTLENLLIDITASGANYKIIAKGNDWVIRNLGIKGHLDVATKESSFYVEVTDESGSGLIENVYLGDGGASGQTGLYVSSHHAGDLEIRNVNVQGWPDNGIYGSSPGNPPSHPIPGGQGAVRVYDSYAADCRANIRLGTSSSLAKNCVSVDPRAHPCFWSYYGNGTRFVDCDASNPGGMVYRSGSSMWNGEGKPPCGDPGMVLENCRGEGDPLLFEAPCSIQGSVDPNPRTDPPEGVPSTAEEAASGSSGGTGGDDQQKPERVLEIHGDRGRAEYEFTVGGDLQKSAANGATIDDEDAVDGSTATGHVWGGTDRYRFSGDLQNLSLSAPATVSLDGRRVAPFTLVSGADTENVTYEFTVEGSVTKNTSGDVTAEGNDSVTDNGDGSVTVSGVAGNGYGDAYLVEGAITSVALDADEWTLRYAGEEVSPDALALPNVLEIHGDRGRAEYEFTVGGDLQKSAANGATIDDEDAVDGSTATGHVWGGTDRYRFSGDLQNLSLSAPATVSLNGREVDPTQL